MAARVLEGIVVEDHVEMGIGEYFWRVADRYGERIFQIDGSNGETETFSSVRIRAVRVALHLQKMGLSQKDAVILCDNINIDNIIPIIALWLIGAIPAPVYGSWEDYYLTHAVKDIKPKAIISLEEKLPVFTNKQKTDGETPIWSTQQIKQISLQKIENEQTFQPVKVDPQNIGFILFSSGTTSLPKAICISHFSLLNESCRRHRVSNCVLDKPLIRQIYFQWISAVWTLMSNILFAQPNLVISTKSVEDVLGLIETYKVETLQLGHLFIVDLQRVEQKLIVKFDLSCVRNIFFGGSRTAPQDITKIRNIFHNENTYIVYGSTEIGTFATIKRITDSEHVKKLESSGKPTKNVKIKIVNPDTEESLGPNEKGEIRVKSPYRLVEFKDNPEKTEQLFDQESFLKTNDLGYYDEDGDLYVIGRLNNTFKYKMDHYHAEDVQVVLKNHPAIEDAVVLGIEHEIDYNRPAACIILRKGQNVSKQEISDYVANNMSEFHRPTGGIEFFDSFPMTSSQKVSMMELKKLFLDDRRSK